MEEAFLGIPLTLPQALPWNCSDTRLCSPCPLSSQMRLLCSAGPWQAAASLDPLHVNCVGVTVGWAMDCEVITFEHPSKSCLLGAWGGESAWDDSRGLSKSCLRARWLVFVNLTQARVIWEEGTEELACLHLRLKGHLGKINWVQSCLFLDLCFLRIGLCPNYNL